MRKVRRYQRELKAALSSKQGLVSPDVFSVQIALIPLLLGTILKLMKKADMNELLEYMDDTAITNEMFREHLLTLTLDPSFSDKFSQIDSTTKAAFTRAYNKVNKEITRVGKGAAKVS